jgi:hypothetical protein
MTVPRSRLLAPLGLLALLAASLGVAGCGGGAQKAAHKAHKATSSPEATIKSDWQAFFSPKTPASKRVGLLQDGQSFASVIKAGEANPLAKSVAAKVSKVTLAPSGKSATVVYTVTLGGKPALSNEKGQAVLQNGTWKVGTSSFCALLKLESVTTPACGS